ncbi:BLUF domain-containing protein [Piscinibacter gummiphilus]|uniref:BLUF domain-containing protein n=1 Tax=Piscinibacter gummiphilus TaxID=946333 RepID=A0ABZ0CYE3_9BURK|nr:BLUF domain-containing protein [Piscinibacter gummiphilus]WOB09970.1 BLUF domain-containing protein [Piscinibacter gummiphilus]
MHTSDPLSLSHVFYVSRSLATPIEVDRILRCAREQNSHRGVTGSLLFTGGHFAQLLEGTPAAVADTMAIIGADRRHTAVKRLAEGDLSQRRFGAWSMAFAEAPGADDLIEQLLSSAEVPPERAQRLMRLMFETAPL